MKNLSLTLYTYSELSKDVKSELVDKFRFDVMGFAMDGYNSDWMKCLSEFEDLTGTKLKHFEVGYCGSRYGSVSFNNYTFLDSYNFEGFEPDELKGKYLFRYLYNNILPNIISRKTFWGKFIYDANGAFIGSKKRTSKILYSSDLCVLTGFCGDYCLIEPILRYCENWCKYPDKTLKDLYQECYDGFINDWYNDYQGCTEDDFVSDYLENNDCFGKLFLEDGTEFKQMNL